MCKKLDKAKQTVKNRISAINKRYNLKMSTAQLPTPVKEKTAAKETKRADHDGVKGEVGAAVETDDTPTKKAGRKRAAPVAGNEKKDDAPKKAKVEETEEKPGEEGEKLEDGKEEEASGEDEEELAGEDKEEGLARELSFHPA